MVEMTREEFEDAVSEGLDLVPEELTARMDNVVVLVEDEPTAEQLDGADPEHGLLGIYEGTPLTERDAWWESGSLPDRITIFRGPTLRMCETPQEVAEEVAVTVVHEIAHHFGIDDERLHELGWAWGPKRRDAAARPVRSSVMEDGTVEQTVEATFEVASILLWTGVGIAVGILGVTVLLAVARVIGRRRRAVEFIERRLRKALVVMGAVVFGWMGFVAGTPQTLDQDQPGWRGIAQHGVVILIILVAVWIATSLVRAGEDIVLNRPGQDLESRHGRRVVTQTQILRRLAVAIIVIIGFASALFTFPEARTAGASLLASAGIASVVAGLAAQSTLGSVFAGLQIAVTDSLRVGDAVFVEDEFGLVEELTLTYVVIHIWDGRRIVMPSTYFTTTPFENWTRRSSELLDAVEFDLDWRVPVEAMRAEMDRLLAGKAGDLWDERVGVFQVLDATGGTLRVRALVSAKDAPTMVDLRYYLREELVKWIKREAPHALPRTRIEGELADVEALRGATDDQALDSRPVRPLGGRRSLTPAPRPAVQQDETRRLDPEEMFSEPSALYTGSPENERRAEIFTGPDDEVQAERAEEAERRATEGVFVDAHQGAGTDGAGTDGAGTGSAPVGITDSPNDGETQAIPVTKQAPGEGTSKGSR